jgi:hypothetical protein
VSYHTQHPKPATLRRRRRQEDLRAGRVPVDQQRHGDPYWSKNWGCDCLTCTQAQSKLNAEQYLARKTAAMKAAELRGSND